MSGLNLGWGPSPQVHGRCVFTIPWGHLRWQETPGIPRGERLPPARLMQSLNAISISLVPIRDWSHTLGLDR